MKYILHIDTSADAGMVAVARDGQVLSLRNIADARSQAAVINLLIDEALKEAGIALKDLCAVAVCSGPGSYTGLRIGMATGKALCYVLDIPLLLHDRLTLLALQEFTRYKVDYDRYVALLIARHKEYFISIFDNVFNVVLAPGHVFEEDLVYMCSEWEGKILVSGDIWPPIANNKELQIKHIDNRSIDLNNWVLYALEQYDAKKYTNIATAEPLYLKDVYTHNNKNIK